MGKTNSAKYKAKKGSFRDANLQESLFYSLKIEYPTNAMDDS